MPHTAASIMVTTVIVYLGAGLVLAPAMALIGVRRIDPAARTGTPGFRLLIIPGLMLLWPLMLVRVIRGGPPPEERNAHRIAARREAGR